MDQGFNDDELADIMNEIESLEKEFGDDTEQQPTKSVESEEVEAKHNEEVASHEHVVQLKEEQIESARENSHDDHNVHHMKSSQSESKTKSSGHHSTAVEFSVQGEMQLNLKFNVGGREIMLKIDEHNFDIELEHGMKFNLPLEQKKSA